MLFEKDARYTEVPSAYDIVEKTKTSYKIQQCKRNEDVRTARRLKMFEEIIAIRKFVLAKDK